MFAPRPLITFALVLCFLAARIYGQENGKKPSPEPWQIAGIRAAFGEGPEFLVEQSEAVHAIALHFCAMNDWGAPLEPSDVAKYFSAPDKDVREASLKVAAQMGKRGKSPLEPLVALLDSNDDDTRWLVINALVSSNSPEVSVATRIAPLLRDRKAVTRAAAAEVFRFLGKAGAKFTPEFGRLLKDPDPKVRQSAAIALAFVGKDAVAYRSQLYAALDDDDIDVVVWASFALEKLDGEKRRLPEGIVRELRQDSERAAAKTALHLLFQEKLTLNEVTSSLLTSRDPKLRKYGIDSVAAMDDKGASFADKLVGLLTDPDPIVCASAIRALAKIDPKGDVYFDNLAAQLKSEDRLPRATAARALGQMGERAAVYAADFANMLKDENAYVRRFALEGLAGLGERAAKFTDAVVPLLHDRDALVSSRARLALKAMIGKEWLAKHLPSGPKNGSFEGNDEALAKLAEMGEEGTPIIKAIAAGLTDSDEHVRRRTVIRLHRLGKAAAASADSLAAALADPNTIVRSLAAEALGRTGEAGAAHADAVAALLQDSNESVRLTAASALTKMGKARAECIEAVVPLLSSQLFESRATALEVLFHLHEEPEVFAKESVGLLADPKAEIREDVILKLRDLGPATVTIAPQIAAALKSPYEDVRRGAVQIISRMGPAGVAYTNEIAGMLADPHEEVCAAVIESYDLRGNKDGDLALQATCLNALDLVHADAIPALRMHLRYWAGDNADMQRSVTWLGKPAVDPMPKAGLPPAEAQAVLSLFARLWDQSANLAPLRKELVARVAEIAKRLPTKADPETQKLLNELKSKTKAQPGV